MVPEWVAERAVSAKLRANSRGSGFKTIGSHYISWLVSPRKIDEGNGPTRIADRGAREIDREKTVFGIGA
jgi:hypothetical protein